MILIQLPASFEIEGKNTVQTNKKVEYRIIQVICKDKKAQIKN